jgi:hypothetical protein
VGYNGKSGVVKELLPDKNASVEVTVDGSKKLLKVKIKNLTRPGISSSVRGSATVDCENPIFTVGMNVRVYGRPVNLLSMGDMIDFNGALGKIVHVFPSLRTADISIAADQPHVASRIRSRQDVDSYQLSVSFDEMVPVDLLLTDLRVGDRVLMAGMVANPRFNGGSGIGPIG